MILGQPLVSDEEGAPLVSDEESAPPVAQSVSEPAGDRPTPPSILQPAPEHAPRYTAENIARGAPAPVSAAAIAALAPPAPAVEAARRAKAQEQRPRTHARSIVADDLAASAVSYASVGPLGADRVRPHAGAHLPSSYPVPPRFRRCRSACRRGVESRGRGLRPSARKTGLARPFSNFCRAGGCPLANASEGEGIDETDTRGRRRDARAPRERGLRVGDTAGRPCRASARARPLQAVRPLERCRARRRVNRRIRTSRSASSAPATTVTSRSRTPSARTPLQGTRTSPASRPARPRTARADARAERKRSARMRTTASPRQHCRTPRRVARATRTSQSGS